MLMLISSTSVYLSISTANIDHHDHHHQDNIQVSPSPAPASMTSVIPKVTQLSSRVIRVLGCNPGYYTLQGTNTYIIGTGKKRALIDCGEPDVPEYIDSLKEVVSEHGFSLSKIIITHWHPDHVGGTRDVLKHVADKDCKVFKMKNTQHDPLYSDFFELNFVKDQDEVEVEGATVKLHWTPGHAKDHLALYLKEEDSLFSGDCVLGEGTVVFEDLLTYLQSLNKITALNSKRLYPGHGPVVTDPVEKVNEYIDKRMSRERQIVEALSRIDGGYLTSMEIVKITYNDSLPPSLMFGAEHNVRMHLEKLIKEDRVETLKLANSVDEELATIKYRLKRSAD